MLRVIARPRFGRQTGRPVAARSVTGISGGTYNLFSESAGSEVSDYDVIFFSDTCNEIPTEDSATQAAVMQIHTFHFPTKTGHFTFRNQTALIDANGLPRVLAACYATNESLSGGLSSFAFSKLDDTFTVIPVPRLGVITAPGDINVLSGSNPDFYVNPMVTGDLLYFKEAGCHSITRHYTNDNNVNSTDGTAFLEGHSFDTDNMRAKVALPSAPFLTSPGATAARFLKACYIPAGAINTMQTNIVELLDQLIVVPEPTTHLRTSWHQHQIGLLDFSQPRHLTLWSSGMAGDMLILMKESCKGAYSILPYDFFVGTTYSARATLRDNNDPVYVGGLGSSQTTAQGKLNEMSPGLYKICFATKHTLGDAENDFKMLGVEFEILPPTVEGPSLTVPRTIPLGADIVVQWHSNIGYSSRASSPGTWVGLYRYGECADHTVNKAQLHTCYLGFAFVEPNVVTGEVRFSVEDYQLAGLFEARYFRGDSLNSQGQACRGFDDGQGSDMHMECIYEAAYSSTKIQVVHGVTSIELAGVYDYNYIHGIKDNTKMEKFRREYPT